MQAFANRVFYDSIIFFIFKIGTRQIGSAAFPARSVTAH